MSTCGRPVTHLGSPGVADSSPMGLQRIDALAVQLPTSIFPAWFRFPPVRDYTGSVQNRVEKIADLAHNLVLCQCISLNRNFQGPGNVAAVTMVLLYFALQRQLAAPTNEQLNPFVLLGTWSLDWRIVDPVPTRHTRMVPANIKV
uniref:Uncharacterized protein n=1 Tax=Timema genevievae TaxID=629358 RepID=A0A7R9K745_TIMGE|nr:unnamed protein product [Timema genevievae]